MQVVRRAWPLLALAVLVAVVAVVGARPTLAQSTLVLSHFNQAGLEPELLALITAGETSRWYARARFGDIGTLVDGELGIGPDNNGLLRIEEVSSGNTLTLNHDASSPLVFSSYFGSGGAGEDLTLHIQVSPTEVYSMPVSGNLGNTGGGYVNFNLAAMGGEQAIDDVSTGSRVIIAFTRPSSVAPVFADDSYSRGVSETALTGANVGDAITATHANSDTLGYVLSGTNAADFSVSATGQITVARALDYETTPSYSLTLTATDTAGATDTATVNIAVTNVDERPLLTPDPSTLAAHINTNQQFTVSLANARPTQNVTVTTAAGTGEMRLRATETGLTCETTITSLSVASAGTFYARFCDEGTATLSVAPSNSAVDVREYMVTITDPITAPAQVTGLTATAGPGAGEVTLDWTAPSDGGSAITDYEYALSYIGYEDVGTWYSTGSTTTSHVVTRLTNYGAQHQFWVRAVNAIGMGPSSGSATATPGGLPGAPTGLSATAGELAVSLSWTAGAANGGTLSRYEYSSDNGTTWRTTGGTDTSYRATQTSAATPADLVGGTEYTFRVRGVTEFGNSTASASASATPEVEATHPEAITNLTATHGDSSVTLDWTVPGNGGSPITSYDYSSDNGTTWRTTATTTNQYVVTRTSGSPRSRLANGTAYTFQVRALNDQGTGDASNAVTETPRTTPGVPTALLVTPMDARVDLAWTAPDNGGAAIVRYQYSTDGGANWASTGSTSTSYSVTQTSANNPTNLVNGTEYQFAVRAVNSEGRGRSSNAASGTPQEAATAPGQVTGLAATAGNGRVALGWTAPSNGGSQITRYEYSSDDGTTWRTTGGTDTSYPATQTSAASPSNLVNGRSYTFRVRAVNTIGAGQQSSSVTATPRAPSPPSAPTGFTATAGLGLVALSWTAPSVDHDETITDYEYSSDDGTTWRSTGSTALIYTATQTSAATPVNLALGTEYTFRVRAVNSAGNGAQSARAAATPYGLPGAPSNLQATEGNASVVLNWTGAAANGRNILRYEYSSDNGTTWRTTGGTDTSYRATQTSAASPSNLVNGRSYTFRVRAVNSVGNGPQSNSAEVTPTTAPDQVTGLTGRSGDGFVDLDWTAPYNGGASITRYEYTTFSGTQGPWRSTGSTNSEYQVTQTSAASSSNLVNGTSYTFRVRACNVRGCGSESAEVSATPNNLPPAFPRDNVNRSVDENQSVGTNVGAAVTAADPENNSITYSITGTNRAGFTVSSTGQIQTGQVLDHEASESHTITLKASATGGSDTVAVTITVNDLNDPPAYSSDSTTRSVPENSAVRTNVGAPVTANDPDSGDSLVYTLTGGGGRFSIVSGTGQIRVATGANLDYETTPSYDVTVRATDSGNLHDSIDVTINITDTPELAALNGVTVPPAGITRSSARPAFALSNHDGVNTTVYVRYRTPPGRGSWLSGGTVSTTGTSVSSSLDGLMPGTSYRVQGALSSGFTSTVQADFRTTANSAPVFSPSEVTRKVEENRLAGTNVGAPVRATDSDGDTITYTMGGPDASSFDLDDAIGQITVGSGTALDYETKTSYSVTVTATDTFDGTDSVAVTIEVNDIREAGILGRIVITVGDSGTDYGYDSGSYGSLDGGTFPGDLFDDDASRTVAEIYEDADGYWYFTYSGGAANAWNSDQDALNEITIVVTYESGADSRSFVFGGFIDSTPGNRGLKLDPPLPSREWDGKDGEEIAFEFHRHRAQVVAVIPSGITSPTVQANSFVEFLSETTPGGPVMAQSLIVILVYVMFLYKTPSSPQGIMMAAIVLILTPWGPVLLGFGDSFAAAIILVNVVAGAYAYKSFTGRSE